MPQTCKEQLQINITSFASVYVLKKINVELPVCTYNTIQYLYVQNVNCKLMFGLPNLGKKQWLIIIQHNKTAQDKI